MSLVDVLPFDPAMPITFPPQARRTWRAMAPSGERLAGLQDADPRKRPRASRPAEHGDRAGGRDRLEKVVPVGPLALERAEQRTRARGARVADDTLDASCRIAAQQSCSVELARRERDHPSSSCATVR